MNQVPNLDPVTPIGNFREEMVNRSSNPLVIPHTLSENSFLLTYQIFDSMSQAQIASATTIPQELLGKGKVHVFIDRGGTFTDCIGTFPIKSHENSSPDEQNNEKTVVLKLLSTDPTHYPDAPREGIRRILEIATGIKHPRNVPLDTSNLGSIRMGTTVATNALLERQGEPTLLVVTKGFRDLLRIGNQARPNLFDLKIERPDMLYSEVIEIDERVTLVGYQMNPAGVYADDTNLEAEINNGTVIKGISGEFLRIIKRPDLKEVEKKLKASYEKGIRSVSICFLHSYTFPDHEDLVGNLALKIGFTHASLSHKVLPMIKVVPRGHSSTADGYLTPHITKYITDFTSGFDDGISDPTKVRLEFMQSDGGLAPVSKFSGLHAVLSGPAAGVVGYGQTTYDKISKTPVIGLDIGGTSTDVSRYSGHLDHVFETSIAGITILAPQLDINTVAAGGGSILTLKNGLFAAGPGSAGANPGPACYRKGGPLTITDANLVLGRLQPKYFPHIFGKLENEPLSKEASLELFDFLIDEINSAALENPNIKKVDRPSVESVALGFIQVACESICRSIRKLTEERGYESDTHVLAAFGGAGAQFACSVAKILNIKSVFIHRKASVLSAFGLSLSEVVDEKQIPSASVLNSESEMNKILKTFEDLKHKCLESLTSQGFNHDMGHIHFYPMLNLRFEGTDTSLMISEILAESHLSSIKSKNPNLTQTEYLRLAYICEFNATHKREFGFELEGAQVIVDDIRVRSTGKFKEVESGTVYREIELLKKNNSISKIDIHSGSNILTEVVKVYFDHEYTDTGIYMLDNLPIGSLIMGPAIILDKNSTILVEPNWEALITSSQVVMSYINSTNIGNTEKSIELNENGVKAFEISKKIEPEFDATPARMSVFLHRFMSIAEQMGHTLQKTSISTNIKERLDFSCALFDPDGGLVANAPHIPVHLGSMSHAVKYQMNYWGVDGLREGDVICTNHPLAGGTHLPDITIITPVFEETENGFNGESKTPKILFFVASRGHHADIGGITPGSMPPNSKFLYQEGANMKAFKIVSNGRFNLAELEKILVTDPAKYEGCSGSRRVSDVISDLKAQIAANQRGIQLVHKLIKEYSIEIVQNYMHLIQKTAELAVRNLLKRVFLEMGGSALSAIDFMDDGTSINLKVTIDGETGSANFDFSGTSMQVYGNTNAPKAISHSAILYCLRCMIDGYLPLNQGCLIPISVDIPTHSLLDPDESSAVVGGNVLTSQRIVDVIFNAFNACSASQGCMNNLTFGVPPKTTINGEDVLKGWGYYETIAGGHGAGPSWNGQSGVHTHMTNTRITDPEILERRYPVVLHEFSLRKGSGGKGKFRGGDGCVRDIEFLKEMQVSLLTERRVFSPYGLEGGGNGERGINVWKIFNKNDSSDSDVSFSPNSSFGGNYSERYLGSKSTVDVSARDHVIICTPGGGGWGPENLL
ncbi:5-oxoprolinase [Smittium mucronatum]|uniref:5-oxoprolinase n=1 Tax=Smittium mucronatum TaxID=133383 RepID=A0A1R0GUB4_9FUNG|nr:5-oxoprolinase [Smittium mucronatum]